MAEREISQKAGVRMAWRAVKSTRVGRAAARGAAAAAAGVGGVAVHASHSASGRWRIRLGQRQARQR